jgi:hypothetical protein
MPFRKIKDPFENLDRQCKHPEHNPPSMVCLPSGTHEWECPACHQTQIVRVDNGYMDVSNNPCCKIYVSNKLMKRPKYLTSGFYNN